MSEKSFEELKNWVKESFDEAYKAIEECLKSENKDK